MPLASISHVEGDVVGWALDQGETSVDSVPEMVRRICMVDDGDLVPLSKLKVVDVNASDHVHKLSQEADGSWVAWDDLKGCPLNPDKVKEARGEEMGYVFRREVYTPSSLEECKRVTGRGPPAVTTSATSVRPTRARWSGEAKEAGGDRVAFICYI